MAMVRVAMVQFESDLSVEVNRERLVSYTRHAAEEGADVVSFHEIANTHYFCYDNERESHFELAEPVPGETTDAVQAVCDELGIHAVLPIYERDGESRFNTVAYLEPKKGVVGKYRKTHVPMTRAHDGQKGADESFYFMAGDTGFQPWEPSLGASVGSLICYDRHFPEGVRAYATQGVGLIFVPTASYRGFIIEELWEAELQAMAFQNGLFVVGINKIGPVIGDGVPEGARYPGRSVVVSPEGRIVAQMGDEEGIMTVEVDLGEADRVRNGSMRFLERLRPDMYR